MRGRADGIRSNRESRKVSCRENDTRRKPVLYAGDKMGVRYRMSWTRTSEGEEHAGSSCKFCAETTLGLGRAPKALIVF